MIRLLIVRHGIAEEHAEGLDDTMRALTPEGKRKLDRAVKGLNRLDERIDRLLHSPWLRAQETADRLAPLVDGETEVCPQLAEAPGPALLARLEALAPANGDTVRIAVVGHEPWLGQLASWLLFGKQGDHTPLRKGGVVILEGAPQPRGMALVMALPPGVLRRLR